ncbi:hypothetical protein I302_101558 [Kwoniella bestiolae CBS 10118]|uniref:Uncharacterized protein n=1 Tax=Kwoniella bestiolae CBS 10118 TaxID=1296100 RepID=A0AAJ8M6M4_9TREE
MTYTQAHLYRLVCQSLSNYALVVFPVKYWVMFNFISWSIVTICSAAAKDFAGLMLLQFSWAHSKLPSYLLSYLSACGISYTFQPCKPNGS